MKMTPPTKDTVATAVVGLVLGLLFSILLASFAPFAVGAGFATATLLVGIFTKGR